jgi:hypothetical protein
MRRPPGCPPRRIGAGGEEGVRLQPEELRPGRADPAWRRAKAALPKQRGDRRGRHVDPELQELPPDPEVALPGILPAQTKDQLFDRGIEWRTTGPARPASSTARQLSVPPEERVGADQEALPPIPGEEPARRGEEGAVGGGEPRSRPSSAENLQLVAEHGRLEIPLTDTAPGRED